MLEMWVEDQANTTGRSFDVLLPEVPANLVHRLKQRALDIAGLRNCQDLRMVD